MGIDIKELTDTSVEVGFFSDVIHPESEATKKFSEMFSLSRNDQDVATIAKSLNDGFYNKTIGKYISPRPFMDNAVEEIENNLDSIIEECMMSGNFKQTLGEKIRDIIIKNMDSGDLEPNSPLTVFLKESSKPLQDEGFLKNSVEVRDEQI